MSEFANRLLHWYDQQGRKTLPWRIAITPYKTWVSEIMLQQTQVATVIDYFNRFLARFPDVFSLAKAPLDDVLALWSGLGYYAHARYLHQTAQIIADYHKGEFPSEISALTKLPGIGLSTAGAIVSIAYNQPAAILDGNVKRVLCRYFAITESPKLSKTQKILWQHANTLLPTQRCNDYTQAQMDLGATLCTRNKPLCSICPIQNQCQAYQQNLTADIPVKIQKAKLPSKRTYMLILRHHQDIILTKRPNLGIWGGLWSLPECQTIDALSDYLADKFQVELVRQHCLPSFRHTFSHYHLDISPVIVTIKPLPGFVVGEDVTMLTSISNSLNLGLPKPVRSLIQQLELSHA